MKKVVFSAGVLLVMLTASASSALAGGRFYVGFSFGFGSGCYHCYRPYSTYYGYNPALGFYRPAVNASRVIRVPYYYRYWRPAYRVVKIVPRSLRPQNTRFRQSRAGAKTIREPRTYGRYMPRRYVRRR